MQMSISLNNSTVLVLVKSTKLRANSNSNSKLELDDFEPSSYHIVSFLWTQAVATCLCTVLAYIGHIYEE